MSYFSPAFLPLVVLYAYHYPQHLREKPGGLWVTGQQVMHSKILFQKWTDRSNIQAQAGWNILWPSPIQDPCCGTLNLHDYLNLHILCDSQPQYHIQPWGLTQAAHCVSWPSWWICLSKAPKLCTQSSC